MDKNQKFIKRLSKKEFTLLQSVLQQIEDNETNNVDIKKLTGQPDIFRVRVGTIRIIFISNRDTNEILDIGRRNEHTYRDF